jgi:hypothetical protein
MRSFKAPEPMPKQLPQSETDALSPCPTHVQPKFIREYCPTRRNLQHTMLTICQFCRLAYRHSQSVLYASTANRKIRTCSHSSACRRSSCHSLFVACQPRRLRPAWVADIPAHPNAAYPGWFVDIDAQALPDGAYECDNAPTVRIPQGIRVSRRRRCRLSRRGRTIMPHLRAVLPDAVSAG